MSNVSNPWGRDLAILANADGILDLDPGMLEVTGPPILVQALIARQTTPAGSVIDCPNDCFDIRDWLSDGMTPAEMQTLAARVQNELLKDQRVLGCTVQITYDFASSTFTMVESIVAASGPFTLTLSIKGLKITALTSNQ